MNSKWDRTWKKGRVMRHKKLAAVLSSILLVLTSLNIAMAVPPKMNDNAMPIEMQDAKLTEWRNSR